MLSFSSPRRREVSLEGGRNSVRASSWSCRSRSRHFIDRGARGASFFAVSLRWAPATKRWRKSRNRARWCSFSGREGVRECYYIACHLLACHLTRLSSSGGSSSRSRSHIQETKEEGGSCGLNTGFRGRRRLGGARRRHGPRVAFSRLIFI